MNPTAVNPLVYSMLAEMLEAESCRKLEACSTESSIWTKLEEFKLKPSHTTVKCLS